MAQMHQASKLIARSVISLEELSGSKIIDGLIAFAPYSNY
jgi:hypothetical protein